MTCEKFEWTSKYLGKEMPLRRYGHAGKVMLVFPCQGGKGVEFEDFGMVEICRPLLEAGSLQVFTVDSVDNESWCNFSVTPSDRAKRHEQFDSYIIKEVLPFIRTKVGKVWPGCFTYGASMGGYHAGNFFFRHPDVFCGMLSLSGIFRLNLYIGDYMEGDVYFNSPINYLSNVEEGSYLEQIRAGKIVICVGQGAWEEHMIEDATTMKGILNTKNIPSWVDFWGLDVNHDWPWWKKQLPYFLPTILGDKAKK